MHKLRLILLPFSWIYGGVTAIRNWMYNKGILKSETIEIPSICVGNLSMGGTGKTPHVDYLVETCLNKGLKPAVLSRGYGRKTKGIIEVQENSKAHEVGDEPLFYKSKYKDNAVVFVAENRVLGAQRLFQTYPDIDLLILDDAFQHRRFKATRNLLITDFNHLFIHDYVVPAGNLREFRCGKKRADVILVSKTPTTITDQQKNEISRKMGFDSEHIFFSKIDYKTLKPFRTGEAANSKNVVLVTGIGNPQPLLNELNADFSVKHLKYPDHHPFTQQDLKEIHEKFDIFAPDENGIIVTTEKDYMRLREMPEVQQSKYKWFYKPISVKIDEQDKFNLLLDKYVREI